MIPVSNKPTEQKPGTVRRLLRTLLRFYPVMLPVIVVCILFNAVVSSIPSLFMQKVISQIESSAAAGDWASASGPILSLVATLCVFYVLSLISGVIYQQLLAVTTQGTLKKLRQAMFDRMQNLPVKYFDTHNHGDIMSRYTNDIDTLRQLISQSIPQLLVSGVVVLTVFGIMLYFSVWMTLVVLAGTAAMLWVLIYRIIHDFIYKMMQTPAGCTSDIHTRSFTDSFQSFQNLNLIRAVLCILSAHLLPPVILYSL